MRGARVETNPATGEVRVCLPPQALDGLMKTAEITAYTNNASRNIPTLSESHWEHLLRAYSESSENGGFGLAPLHSGAENVRKSAVEALSHRGYVRLVHVRLSGRPVAWSAPITPEGRRAVEDQHQPDPAPPGRPARAPAEERTPPCSDRGPAPSAPTSTMPPSKR